jgi:hypothetical protein
VKSIRKSTEELIWRMILCLPYPRIPRCFAELSWCGDRPERYFPQLPGDTDVRQLIGGVMPQF